MGRAQRDGRLDRRVVGAVDVVVGGADAERIGRLPHHLSPDTSHVIGVAPGVGGGVTPVPAPLYGCQALPSHFSISPSSETKKSVPTVNGGLATVAWSARVPRR